MRRSPTTDRRDDAAARPLRPTGRSGAFEVGVVGDVRALHVMEGLPSPEGELHAHDYRVEVTAEADRLDERGMVWDLDVVGAALAEVLGRIEGVDLGSVIDDGPSVTVEALARWIHGQMATRIAGEGARSLAVRVWEHAEAFGGYRADLP